LLCVDIMLPWDERMLLRCDQLHHERDELDKEIAELRSEKGADDRLAELRQQRNEISVWLQTTIDRVAGVKLIKQWSKELSGESDVPWTPPTAILFLTARQPEADDIEVTRISQYAKWLKKPALELQVVETAAELLVELDKRKQ